MQVVGSLLNWNGGFINACVWAEYGLATTHVTGTATQSAMAIKRQDYASFGVFLLQLFLFISGSFVCSLVVGGQKRFHPGPYYSGILGTIALLVLFASFQTDKYICAGTITFAAGMQNAMTTFFR
jgi:uncharacterized membrane protein YoaK (UPF0700 family)